VGYADGKFPTIENGGAKLSEVSVKEGDKLVDANGNLVTVKGGKLVDDKGAEVKEQKVKNAKFEVIDFKADTKLPQLGVTVKYKPDVWSDGEKVKKADYELGYKVTCAKDSGATSYFGCDRTQNVGFPDDNTLVVTYVPGYTPPTYYLAGYGALPSHQIIKSENAYKGKKLSEVATKDFKTLPEIAETPMSTGPFVLDKWEKGKQMVFVANKNYTGAKPKLNRIIISFKGDTNGAVAALLNGEVDIVGSETLGGGTEAEVVLKAAKDGKIAAESIASATWEHIDFNLFSK
jgi:ABC-type transport system substrate-binding protein